MAPNKDWMDLVDDRLNEAYDKGVQSFLSFAFKRTGENNEIRCPCVKCNNTDSGTREMVETHLKVYGIVRSYTFWYHHGEKSCESQSESDDEDNEETEEDEGVDRDDWKWLVKEHFFSEKFLAASKRNSENRTKVSMPHRTGSKPFRQIIWKKGGKDNNPPSLATIFYETRKKDGQLEGEDTIKKYDEIVEASQSNPSSSNIELIEKCFGSQSHNHVICFGGGVKANDLRPPYSSRAELHTKLCETQKENESLKSRIDGMEVELRAIKEMLQQQFNAPPPRTRSEE